MGLSGREGDDYGHDYDCDYDYDYDYDCDYDFGCWRPGKVVCFR